MEKVLKIEEIKTNPYNPNMMEKGIREKLKKLIQKEGNYPPLIVNKRKDGSYILLDGHQRLQVLKELGYKEIKCDIWEIEEEDEYLVLATINRLRGKPYKKLQEELFKILEKKVGKKAILEYTAESRKFYEKLNLMKPKLKIDSSNYIPWVQFIQRLTIEQYDFVIDFIDKNFKGKDKDCAIYYIIKELLELRKLVKKEQKEKKEKEGRDER